MNTYRRKTLLLLGTLLCCLGMTSSINHPAVHAQADEICFSETGHCIAGAIRAYWQNNGGMPVFGYPITALRPETVDGTVVMAQWFQRDRLEDHGAAGVLAGRLGATLLELQDRPWQEFEQEAGAKVGCLFFPETGQNLCEPFLSHWYDNGSVERFGYPITSAFEETIGDWSGLVQYFERRRMEYHTELPDNPVLLGLLGEEILSLPRQVPPEAVPSNPPAPPSPSTPPIPSGETPECVRTALNGTPLQGVYERVPFNIHLGCPIAYIGGRPVATQSFERGEMLWIDLESNVEPPPGTRGRFIFAMFSPGANPGLTFQRYNDTWIAGRDVYIPRLTSPRPNLYPPTGGFGKIWVQDSNLRDRIGWSTESREQRAIADVVIFDNIYNDHNNRGFMILINNTNTVYVFGRQDQPDEVAVLSR